MKNRKEYNKKNKERIDNYNHEHYKSHKEERKTYMENYYAKNKIKILNKNKEYHIKNRERILQQNKIRYELNKTEFLEQKRQYHKETYPKIKKDVLTYYGNDKLECVCCGENTLQFLTIDHINNDGYIHRRKLGKAKMYLWLKSNNYPIGFQTLCFNCNSGKNVNKGICPHRLLKKTLPIEVVWSN